MGITKIETPRKWQNRITICIVRSLFGTTHTVIHKVIPYITCQNKLYNFVCYRILITYLMMIYCLFTNNQWGLGTILGYVWYSSVHICCRKIGFLILSWNCLSGNNAYWLIYLLTFSRRGIYIIFLVRHSNFGACILQ